MRNDRFVSQPVRFGGFEAVIEAAAAIHFAGFHGRVLTVSTAIARESPRTWCRFVAFIHAGNRYPLESLLEVAVVTFNFLGLPLAF